MSAAMDELQKQENLVRHLVEQPSTLKPARLRLVRARAMEAVLASNYMRGYFAGEFSAGDPDIKKYLEYGHQHYADQLAAPLKVVFAELSAHLPAQKKSKGGRPAKQIDESYWHVIKDHLYGTRRPLLACVRTAAKARLIDHQTADATHVRRVERYFEMLKRKFATPAVDNVIDIAKHRRTKPKK